MLTQQGLIYQGSARFIKSVPWNFGQVGPHPAPHSHLRPAGLRGSQRYKGVSGPQSHPPRPLKDGGSERAEAGLRSHSKGVALGKESGEPVGAVELVGTPREEGAARRGEAALGAARVGRARAGRGFGPFSPTVLRLEWTLGDV